jgi:energy-coupling factor transporter ATP-binding protein EcfA2
MASAELDELKARYDVTSYVEGEIVIPKKPESGLVMLVGSSGSGKTTILKDWFGKEKKVLFSNHLPLIENFSSVEKGEELLKAFGLRSIPTWFRPFNTLSNGEAHRAFCARSIDLGKVYIDEFTSVVDRNTAHSLCVAVKKWHDRNPERLLVLSTCHNDVEEWLCPTLVYDTDAQKYSTQRYLRRPKIEITIRASGYEDWVLFQKHHYLNTTVSKGCHFYTAYMNGVKVGFLAVIHRTGRDIRTYWGESRLVVLPEYQGLGIGKLLSETIGQEYLDRGLRYFSKTSHPVLGEYRNSSSKWRATSTNMMKRPSYLKKDGTARKQKGFGKTIESIYRDAGRLCYSHEYIGETK